MKSFHLAVPLIQQKIFLFFFYFVCFFQLNVAHDIELKEAIANSFELTFDHSLSKSIRADKLIPNSELTSLIEAELTRQASPNQAQVAEWTIMTYMQARNNLHPFAEANLQAMASSMKRHDINMLIQYDQPNKKGAWRYSAKNNHLKLEDYSHVSNPKNAEDKLVSFVRWAVTTYPAKKYALILWNHGVGAIAPVIGDPLRVFVNPADHVENPRAEIPGLVEIVFEQDQNNQLFETKFGKPEQTTRSMYQGLLHNLDVLDDQLENSEIINDNHCDKNCTLAEHHHPKRGILFDDENHTFLSNQHLMNALKTIASPSIIGRNLDLIGFDACFMGMHEVAHACRKYANIMVSSEELELAKGWNYAYFLDELNKSTKPKSAIDLGKDIVTGYQRYYHGTTQYYTQSVMDLKKSDDVTKSLDELIVQLEVCINRFGKPLINAIKKARLVSQQFTTKFYVDLHSFYNNLAKKIVLEQAFYSGSKIREEDTVNCFDTQWLTQRKFSPEIITLMSKIKNGLNSIEGLVLQNTSSSYLRQAKGVSIYFPTSRIIDQSYLVNDFCQHSRWPSFLSKILDMFYYVL